MKKYFSIFFAVFYLVSCLAQSEKSLMDSIRLLKLEHLDTRDFVLSDSEKLMVDWQISFLKDFDVTSESFKTILPPRIEADKSPLGDYLFYLNLGDFYFFKYENDVLQAQKAYLKALNLGNENNNSRMICQAIKRILEINKHSFLIENNSEFYLQLYSKYAYDKFEEAYFNYYKLLMAFQYHKDKAWDKDLENHLQAVADTLNIPFLRGKIYHLNASYYASNQDFDQAIFLLKNAIRTFESIDFNYKKTQLTNSKIALLRYYVLSSNYHQADSLLKEIRYIKPNGLDQDNERYLLFHKAIIDSANGSFLKAFNSLMQYTQASERFLIKNNKRIFDELNTKYETAEKENQILLEQQRVKEQTQKATANRNWLIAAVLALLLGFGIAVLLQKNTTKKHQLAEQEALLKQQRVENLLKEQELVSIDAMIAGQEKERQRVANELHDDLGSLMATIQLHFENAKVSKKDPALKNAQKLLEQAYQKVRGMAHHKNSGVMSDQGLLPAIQKMARTISETNALEVTVEDFGLGERMENSLELTLFRMIQELVANAIKHAGATEVDIQLTQHEANLNIIVADNGKGFDRTQLDATHTGMGLTNVEKRVEHLEGSFTIDSVMGKGTSILIDIPV